MSVNSTRKMMLNTVGRVDHSRERKLYKMIAKRMLAAGYTRSSAWCFSQRPGMSDEYIAGREEYLGLGSGSFSYLQGSLYASTFSINHYLRMLQAGKTGTDYRRDMSERDQMRYFLLTELFAGSLEKVATETRFEGRFQRTMWPELAALRAIGAIRDSAGVLTLTESGYYLWVLLMREFLTGINGLRDQMRHNIAHAIPIQPPTAARF
jgi:coproporphyrinogen III oxidase-like Fe-S oxidoreductase